ncbi:LPS export ABC transporter periplasmic protein LptC [Neiella marina]|uniref:Lipopolysaccharide export system protein LptC n=1 Tax=Neiella holothuriorum TaxID=2870530 RepID=A0ABS7EB71_9GAMM|nr:LPS export ABC transporter periplasmic protein LptC [Neiella holothuriorum]MBW8189470.1 LPS export ABC transporter periplasmic protein LptC [Neiella holothuriorum]
MSRLTLVSVLLLIAALLFNALMDSDDDTPQETELWGSYEPDYVANNLFNRNYDANGQLESTVYAETMESYPDLSMTIFARPEVTLYDSNTTKKPAWHVTASEGSHYPKTQQLQLRGNVTIKANDQTSQIQTISTPFLVLEIESNQMHTDEYVTAVGPHLEMKGQGLEADLNSEQIQVLQQVETTYEHTPAN